MRGRRLHVFMILMLLLEIGGIASCGGGSMGGSESGGGIPSHAVSGTVSGLTGTAVLQNNGADDLTIISSGAFTFATAVESGRIYSVTVLSQPIGQLCSVASGVGTIQDADVTNVLISCSVNTKYVGGTVSGLTGTLILQNNSANDNILTTNGTFQFSSVIAGGSPYRVTVKMNPMGQLCLVSNGSGTVTTTDITNVMVSCTNYNIIFTTSTTTNGNLSGLAGADAICNARATAAGLPPGRTYVAWLSTGGTGTVNAKDRLGTASGWIRTDGLPFARSQVDLLAGKILYPPRLDEFGSDLGKGVVVFSATNMNGLFNTISSTSCSNWTSNAVVSTTGGYADGGTRGWTAFPNFSCAMQARIYCMGKDFNTAVPSLSVAGRKAFISASYLTPGSGLSGADGVCQLEATNAGYSGSFKALLATDSTTAASRFSTYGTTWYRPDGVAIVKTAAGLATDILMAPLNVEANGTYNDNSGVWVGAAALSALGSGTSCTSWTSASSSQTALGGISVLSGINYGGGAYCHSTGYKLWCLEQ